MTWTKEASGSDADPFDDDGSDVFLDSHDSPSTPSASFRPKVTFNDEFNNSVMKEEPIDGVAVSTAMADDNVKAVGDGDFWEDDNIDCLREELQSQREIIEEQKELIDYFQGSLDEEGQKARHHQHQNESDVTARSNSNRHYHKQSRFMRGRLSSTSHPGGKTKIKEAQLPQDTYSLFVCSKPCSTPFIVAAIIFVCQMCIFIFLAMDQININSDNALSLPPNVETTVRVTQFITIVIAVFTQEDLREALELFSEGYSDARLKPIFPDSTKWKYYSSCMLRFFEGALGLTVTFFVIVAESSVIELLLNFTALEFVSQLDNVAFYLSSVGYFGKVLRLKTTNVADTYFPVPSIPRNERRFHSLMLFVIMGCMMGAWSYVIYKQTSNDFLCKEIFVQFGDEASSALGAYTGLYSRTDVKRRNDYRTLYSKTGWVNGTFAYCSRKEAWVLSPTSKSQSPCKNCLAMSSTTKTFDIRDTESSTWTAKNAASDHGIQIEHFRLTCIDEDTSGDICKTDLCSSCPHGAFGINCAYSEGSPCRLLIDEDSDGFPLDSGGFLSEFELLEDENMSKSYQFYYSPVYLPVDDENGMIYFSGRRWYLLIDLPLGPDFSTMKEFVIDMHESGILPPRGSVTPFIEYVSETVDIVSVQAITTPLGLQWFAAGKEQDENGLPLPDKNRRLSTYLSCGLCHNVTNPCLHGGICRSDGECKCENNGGGRLCKETPVGDGFCDEFFNTEEYEYDGGDCCGATCVNRLRSSCGRHGSVQVFGETLGEEGKLFPNCKDPSMVNIIIELLPGLSSLDVEVELVCNNVPFLQLPKGVVHVENHTNFNGTEVVRVQDGSDCDLTFSVHDERVEVGVVDFDVAFTVHLENKDTGSVTKTELVNMKRRVWLDGNSSSIKTSFFVSSLLEALTPFTSRETLENPTTPQGAVIRFLSTSSHPHAFSESKFLPQRYAAFVVNYALGDVVGISIGNSILSTLDECEFRTFLQCDDNHNINFIDLSRGGFQGALPPELAVLTNLEQFIAPYNNIFGNLPTKLGMLGKLRRLDLSNNAINGTIPSELGNMKSLTDLDLSSNSISGNIPEEIYQAKSLKILHLSNNDITGSISANVSNLADLEKFMVEHTNMTGTIPPSMGVLANLNEIDIENNLHTGTIPTELGALAKLGELDLDSNKLWGTVPSELGQLSSLEFLGLNYNQNISGTIPVELCDLEDAYLYLRCTRVECRDDCARQCNSSNCSN